MAESDETPVLRRMAGAHSVKVGPTVMTVAKALRNALAKAGDQALKTVVNIREFDEGTHLPEDLTDHLPDDGVYLMLRGPGSSIGVAVACPQCMGAVIEATTMGKVQKRESGVRKATGTDAALLRTFLDPLLDAFGKLAIECDAAPPATELTCDALLSDGRAAQMVLADAVHIRLTAEVDFDLGAKSGKISLILPKERHAATTGPLETGIWSETLKNSVMATHAIMEATLCELTMPLEELANFEVGQVVPLGNARLDDVGMVGPDDNQLMTAKLGRSGAWRAVKIGYRAAGQTSDDKDGPEFEAAVQQAASATLPHDVHNPASPNDAPLEIEPNTAGPIEVNA